MRSFFSWFSISSLRALPSFSSVDMPQPILVAGDRNLGRRTSCEESEGQKGVEEGMRDAEGLETQS